MNQRIRRVFSWLLAATFLAALPIQSGFLVAHAGVESTSSATTVETWYLDESGERQEVEAIPVTEDEEKAFVIWNTGWYVLNSSIDTWDMFQVKGDVHLILQNGCQLSTKNSILVSEGNSLTIYAQSEEESDMGGITAKNSSYYAAIGGMKNAGSITIHGGKITATAGNGAFGAGIGGGKDGNGGAITITGGIVTATTEWEKGVDCGAAAIGGGSAKSSYEKGGSSGNITISGGTVTAIAKSGGAGIGGGGSGSSGGDAENIAITGGTVYAESTNGGAGIGGGSGSSSGIGGSANVSISGGEITAISSAKKASSFASTYKGAGIGTGHSGTPKTEAGTISITGGNIYAKGGTDTMNKYGAGIGGGYQSTCGTVTIGGGTLVIDSNDACVGIGSGYGTAVPQGEVEITGGTICSKENKQVQIKNPTNGNEPVYYTMVGLNNVYGENAAVTNATLNSYSFQDVQTDSLGQVHLYLPNGTYSADFDGTEYTGKITEQGPNELKPTEVSLHVTAAATSNTSARLDITGTPDALVTYVPSDTELTAQDILNATGRQTVSIGTDGTADVSLSNLTPQSSVTYYLVAQKDGKMSDVVSVTVTPQAIDLEQAVVTITPPEGGYIYDGTSHQPDVTVTLNGEVVAEENYTVQYENSNGTDGDTTNVGTVTVIVRGIGGYTGTAQQQPTYEISPKQLSAQVAGSTSKIYDGTTDVINTDQLHVEITGVVGQDEVTVQVSGYQFADPGAGEQKVVCAVGPALTGSKAENYQLPESVSGNVGTIEKSQPTIAFDGYDGKTYDGQPMENPKEEQIMLTGGGTFSDLVFQWCTEDGELMEGPPVNAGTYSLKVSLAATENTNAGEETKEITITKASYNENINFSGYVKAGVTGTVGLSDLPEGAQYGEPSAYDTHSVLDLKIEGNQLRYTGGTYIVEGMPYVVMIPVTESVNYMEYMITVTLTGQGATPVPVDMSGITLTDKVYDGAPITYTGSASVQGETIEFSYSWYDADGQKLDSAPSSAGTYTLRATVVTPGFAGTGEKQVVIQKAPVVIRAESKTAYVGDPLPKLTYTVQGLVGQDTLVEEPVLSCNADMQKPGEYPIVVSGADGGRNYEISCVNGTLSVTEKSSGGGSSSQYEITVPSYIENGTVSTNIRQAKKGDTVTITVRPDPGYEVESLKILDKNGKEISYQEGENGTVTFRMPGSAVKICVTFAPIDLPYVDVPSDAWYAEAVRYVTAKQLMNGMEGNQFAPNVTLSRAMIVTILYRMDGEPEVSGSGSFEDVPSGTWYTNAVQWAADNGIVNGMEGDRYAPNDGLTREQMAVILYRYAQYKKLDVSASGDLSTFVDGDKTSAWAVTAMEWAVDSGLVNGMEGNALAPQGTSTRAQVATVLMRFCENILQ